MFCFRLLHVFFSTPLGTYSTITAFLQTKTRYFLFSEAGSELFLCSTCLRTLSSVFRATLRTVRHTCGIQSSAYDVITNTRQIFHTSATNQYNRVLLQIVSLTRDVGVHFLLVREFHTSHFTHGRIRLFRGSSVNTHAHATPLRARIECGGFTLIHQVSPSFPY
jgi:hypothetical protein